MEVHRPFGCWCIDGEYFLHKPIIEETEVDLRETEPLDYLLSLIVDQLWLGDTGEEVMRRSIRASFGEALEVLTDAGAGTELGCCGLRFQR